LAALEAFLRSGRAADLILLIVFLEAAFLLFLQLRGRAPPPGRWLSPLVAGAALVWALRLALTGGPLPLLGLALAAAGIAHLAGYRQRWRP
jgi:hypothetical protein